MLRLCKTNPARQTHTRKMNFLPAEMIKKKRSGKPLTADELRFFVSGFTENEIPEYQMSALLMAIFFKGLSPKEILDLTQIMIDSGETVKFVGPTVDKHSTGGVGDKTSLILGPIVAACGIGVPMMSGRSLGHTGGTVDKLESIPGFSTQLSLPKFKKMVEENFLSFIGQTAAICPADKKIYALRDVTATVESIPLITASIMSKKIAEGAQGLVLDIKFGSGAFLKEKKQGLLLAKNMLRIGRLFGKKIKIYLTSMQQPLGRFCGNALEIRECLEILQNKPFLSSRGVDLYADTRELSLQLAGTMIFLGGKSSSPKAGYKMAKQVLTSGQALQKFLDILKIQGGRIDELPVAKFTTKIQSVKSGFVQGFDTEAIGWILVGLKAGRKIISDPVDPSCGLEILIKMGDEVKKGDLLFVVHHNDPVSASTLKALVETVVFAKRRCPKDQLISKIL